MMDGLFLYAARNQALALTVIAVLIVLLIVGMVFILLRANRAARMAAEEPPPEPATEVQVVAVTAADVAAQKQEAAKGLRRLLRDGLAACREAFARNPYLMPWVLRIGVGGSSAGGLLEAVDQIRPPVGEPGRDALSWHYYERGVVIDVGDADAWPAVLGFASRVRPALPVDGLVLTVPVQALRDPKRATALGAEAYGLLWRAQRMLGFSIPVYVVVSGTEELPGFQALEELLPTVYHDGMVGWAFPYPMETAFTPDYVTEALQSVETSLLAVALEAYGSVLDGETGAEMLRVRSDLADLEEPLRALLATAFRRTAFQESNYFRGLFFITRPDPEAPASFARDLLDRKIFAENGLSTPLKGVARSRIMRRFAWPAEAAAVVLAAGLSVWASVARVADYERLVVPVLRSTAADVTASAGVRPGEGDAGAAADAAVRYLRNATMLSESEPLVFMPSTWFQDDPYGVAGAMRAGWRHVALAGVKAQIERRLSDLSQSGDTDLPPDVAFVRFMTRVAEAEAFALSFNQIGRTGNSPMVREMLNYALDIDVPRRTIDTLEDWNAIGGGAEPIDDPRLRIDLSAYQDAARGTYLQLADAYFRMLAAGGQAGLRLQLVAEELSLLAVGARAGTDATAGFLEVSAGLEEAVGLLASGQPSWLGADGPVVPPNVQLLMDASVASQILGERAARDAAALARQRYEQVRDRLAAIDSVIGPLVMRHDDGTAALTAPAEQLRQVLDQWLRRRFMAPADQFLAAAPATGYGWDAAVLESVPPLFEDYLLFEAKDQALLPPALRGAARSAAQASLTTTVTRVFDRASTGIDARAAAASTSLAQLRDWARSLRMAVPVIERAVQTYMQIGMQSAADDLRLRVADLAAAIVERIDRMVDEDDVYRASGLYLASWTGGAIQPAALFDQRDMPGLRLRLTQWRMEVATLARETASPMLEVLSRPLLQTPRSMALASKWLHIIAALDAYDGSRPNSSLVQLEKYVLEDLAGVTEETCLGPLTEAGLPGDFFTDRLNGLKQDIRTRCIEMKDERLIAAYAELRGLFEQTLAGRVPFAPGAEQAATTQDVRAFYAAFDRHGDAVTAAIPEAARTRPEWRTPSDFLAAMAAARPLLMYVAEPQPKTRLVVTPQVRAARDREIGGRDIIDWTFTMGERRFSSLAGQEVSWYPGEAAAIELRWAKDGPVVPLRDLGAIADRVDGLAARFAATGRWALLSLLRALEA
ncbi:type VI secretion system protein, partial [Caenispirillum bisanense]|uniref:type VI secretion system protein n=1 Tax=Caenispirillum bisanense TaxID=414052 RepID=UPI0031DFFC0F